LVKARIVGGKPVTDKNKYPFYGFPAGTNNCGATLVHPDMMVTAAACSSYFSDGVVIGGTTIDGTNGTFHQVVGEYVHPLFNATSFMHNIMLIKLARPSRASLVQLNDSPVDPEDTEGVEILGYGALNETGSIYSPTLMMAKVQVAPPARCALYSNFDKKSMMCSWFPHGGRDACKGDTGGPVLMKETKLQVGILSFGKGCGREEYPASNTRVSYYLDFINKIICEHSSTPPTKCL
jgi:secreted trypsin-like serine protease